MAVAKRVLQLDKPSVRDSRGRHLHEGSLRRVVQLQWWIDVCFGDQNLRKLHLDLKLLDRRSRTLGIYIFQGCFNGACKEDEMNDLPWSEPMSSEGMKNDPILEPKHKIFLSHSGAQKEFVEHLCKAFEDRFRYPFFDRRPESLPKGERFPELIVQAAEQCEVLIVVVSDEYFMSKWPMIELNAFIKAHKFHHESESSTKGPKIIPLFYGLSVDDLKDAPMQKKWFQKWETLAKADLIVEDWKDALHVLKSINGFPYDRNLMEIVDYENKIVSYVCRFIPPDIRWDDSHVQGKSRILKVINEKIGVSRQHKVKVVGIYGVGGIGKTTTCKTLCNDWLDEYEGRVCHIEFPIVPLSISREFFQKVLRDLTNKSVDAIQDLDEGQCKKYLHDNLFKHRTFVAIDNILDNDESMKLAKTVLKLPYHPDSLVVVTAHSRSILEPLGLDGDAYLEMPDLEEADAVNLFLHHAARGQQFFESKERDDIMTCVRRCYISKGDGQGHHYHPLALQTLGLQLGFHGENPCDWVKNLPQVNYSSRENPVFDILKSSFDLLPTKDQTLFLQVGHFSYLNDHSSDFVIEWLCKEHKQDRKETVRQLERLKRKGMLVEVDLNSKRISMHDLYREFAHLQEEGGSRNESLEMLKGQWLDADNGSLTEFESLIQSGGIGFFF